MAEIGSLVPSTPPSPSKPSKSSPGQQGGPSGPTRALKYALPAPIRTFPLPSFYPNNPVSVIQLLYTWLGQTLFQRREPALIHTGEWSPRTRSVHIRDEQSMQALWEQGFFGKGSLSRSEPNWLRGEEVRLGLRKEHVSELATLERREQRRMFKTGRARSQQEAIRITRCREALEMAPVSPLQLLALPNSAADRLKALAELDAAQQKLDDEVAAQSAEKSVLANGRAGRPSSVQGKANGTCTEPKLPNGAPLGKSNGIPPEDAQRALELATPPVDASDESGLKRQKSVRFSPRVESTTFQQSDPPSPKLATTNGEADGAQIFESEKLASVPGARAAQLQTNHSTTATQIVNKEHLQLTPEENFFLSFALGALSVVDPRTKAVIQPRDLFQLFRKYSYFPPRIDPDHDDLMPDDKFLVHYAVYHHFRSAGWVPRAGIKFGVDWLIYYRGPVFDHAEYGVMVLPSYTDPWWKARGKSPEKREWPWFHGINRTLSHAFKTLVLVYVDIPPPPTFDDAAEKGIVDALKLYRVREIIVKRWSINRNR